MLIAMKTDQLHACRKRLEAFLEDLFAPLGRRERRYWGGVYVRGLLLDGERKSIEPLARRVPDGNVQALQQFIGQSPWEYAPLRRQLSEKAAREISPRPVWILDDTGFPKKGEHSVGVGRQYSGSLGGVGNCQVAVSLHLGVDQSCIPLNFSLYLPSDWTDNPERLARAGVAKGTTFQTKFELALGLIDEALTWDIPRGVVLCDSFYGKSQEIRNGLIERGLEYVAEISSRNSVLASAPGPDHRLGRPPVNPTRLPVKEMAKTLPAWRWKSICWREGTRKRLASRFTAIRVDLGVSHRRGAIPQPRQWLLIEWPRKEPEPTKFWLSNLPPQTGLSRLVYLAKARWLIERSYQEMKEELGLDHYEGRGFLGWHHHVTMVMVAYAFLLLEKLRCKKNTCRHSAGDSEDDPGADRRLGWTLSDL